MNPKYKKYIPIIDIDTLLALNECGKYKVSKVSQILSSQLLEDRLCTSSVPLLSHLPLSLEFFTLLLLDYDHPPILTRALSLLKSFASLPSLHVSPTSKQTLAALDYLLVALTLKHSQEAPLKSPLLGIVLATFSALLPPTSPLTKSAFLTLLTDSFFPQAYLKRLTFSRLALLLLLIPGLPSFPQDVL
jgi:hypothetical protein